MLVLCNVKCEVLVVGASAAGLMAAITASKAGSDVILMEKELGNLNHTANTLFEGMAARTGIEVQDFYVKNELEGMRIISPSGNEITIPANGYFIDRQKFDSYYLGKAEKSGVRLLDGEATKMRLEGGQRTVLIENDEIRARVVVDATGIGSSLAMQAGLQSMRHPEDIAWAMEALVELSDLGKESFFQYWIGSMAPGWKATFSPAGENQASLGVFVRGYGQDVQPFFEKFLKIFAAYKVKQYTEIGALKILSIKRGVDPIAVLPGEIVADSFMVTGGAAGQSGLAYGMRAGAICGRVASEAVSFNKVTKRTLYKYERLWKSEFYWEYRLGRSSLETLRNMEDHEIDQLIKGVSGKSILQRGSILKKTIFAGTRVMLVRPRMLPEFIWNLSRG